MKKCFLTACLITLTTVLFAQTSTVRYWILFTDKANSPYSLSKPQQYLSDRSIARRERQHIAINERDLPVNPSYVKGVAALGATVKGRSRWFNGVSVSIGNEQQLEAIKALPYVKSVQKIEIRPNSVNENKFDFETNSAKKVTTDNPQQRNLSSGLNYGLAYGQVHQIGMDCMHALGFQGQGMVIAQLDAGWFTADTLPVFDSLRANNQILGCRDFVTGDTMVYEDNPHGMNVLSTMGGNYPGAIIGTAPKAKYWLLRTEDAATESLQEEINWLMGAEFADSVGADVINSSLGYSRFDDHATDHTYADMNGRTTIVSKAAAWAARVGIFVTSSAGNAGGPPWYKITAPADADSILTVGACDTAGVVAYFSSRGPTSDGRIKPNTIATGQAALTAAVGGGVNYENGTSFSSPITAGAVACLWQANPSKTNIELLLAIEQSCNFYNSPDTVRGYGVPNFCMANQILSGVIELDKPEMFSVYPNPAHNAVSIEFYSDKKQTVTVGIFDVAGRRISSESRVLDAYSDNKFSISGSDQLAKGVYVLKMQTEDRLYSKKIVKE